MAKSDKKGAQSQEGDLSWVNDPDQQQKNLEQSRSGDVINPTPDPAEVGVTDEDEQRKR